MNVRSGATSEGGDCRHDSDSDGLCDFQLAGDYQIQSIPEFESVSSVFILFGFKSIRPILNVARS